MKKISIITYTLLLAILIYNPVNAHLRNYSLTELANESNYIFIGEVIKTKTTLTGSKKATVKLSISIKGNNKSNIIVRYGQPYNVAKEDLTNLEVGGKYLFFVVEFEHELRLIGVGRSDYYRIDKNNYVSCNKQKIHVDKCVEYIKQEIKK